MPNQATNFRECVAENLQEVFFGQGHFEEVVDWYDSDGAASRPVTVTDVTAIGQPGANTHHQATGRAVHFLVTKDETLGILMPAKGMSLVRGDCTRWGFHKIVHDDAAAWVLEFVGGALDRVGFGRQSHL